MEPLTVTASDGVDVPIDWYSARRPRAALVFLPALGVRTRLYGVLGTELARHGISTCLLEQRGHGRSPLRASRHCDHGFDAFLDRDIPAVLDWVQSTVHDLPIILGGHSLGGHLSTIYAGVRPGRLAGILHVASSFPYYRDFPQPIRLGIRLLCWMIPVFRRTLGYYPGDRVGFGHREFARLMTDWKDWALTGRFDYGDRQGLDSAVADYRGPVLSVALERDRYSAETGLVRALAPFVNARVDRTRLGSLAQGEAFLGHFDWARRPDGVAGAIERWVSDSVLAS